MDGEAEKQVEEVEVGLDGLFRCVPESAFGGLRVVLPRLASLEVFVESNYDIVHEGVQDVVKTGDAGIGGDLREGLVGIISDPAPVALRDGERKPLLEG